MEDFWASAPHPLDGTPTKPRMADANKPAPGQGGQRTPPGGSPAPMNPHGMHGQIGTYGPHGEFFPSKPYAQPDVQWIIPGSAKDLLNEINTMSNLSMWDQDLRWHLLEALQNMDQNRCPTGSEKKEKPGHRRQNSADGIFSTMGGAGNRRPNSWDGRMTGSLHLRRGSSDSFSSIVSEEATTVTFLTPKDEWFMSGTEPALKAILFSHSRDISPVWQYLADAFGPSCAFGQVHAGCTELIHRFGLKSHQLPTVLAITAAVDPNGQYRNFLVDYKGSITFTAVGAFLSELRRRSLDFNTKEPTYLDGRKRRLRWGDELIERTAVDSVREQVILARMKKQNLSGYMDHALQQVLGELSALREERLQLCEQNVNFMRSVESVSRFNWEVHKCHMNAKHVRLAQKRTCPRPKQDIGHGSHDISRRTGTDASPASPAAPASPASPAAPASPASPANSIPSGITKSLPSLVHDITTRSVSAALPSTNEAPATQSDSIGRPSVSHALKPQPATQKEIKTPVYPSETHSRDTSRVDLASLQTGQESPTRASSTPLLGQQKLNGKDDGFSVADDNEFKWDPREKKWISPPSLAKLFPYLGQKNLDVLSNIPVFKSLQCAKSPSPTKGREGNSRESSPSPRTKPVSSSLLKEPMSPSPLKKPMSPAQPMSRLDFISNLKDSTEGEFRSGSDGHQGNTSAELTNSSKRAPISRSPTAGSGKAEPQEHVESSRMDDTAGLRRLSVCGIGHFFKEWIDLDVKFVLICASDSLDSMCFSLAQKYHLSSSFFRVSTKEFQLMLDIFGVSKSHTPVLVAVERTGKHTHHRDLSYQSADNFVQELLSSNLRPGELPFESLSKGDTFLGSNHNNHHFGESPHRSSPEKDYPSPLSAPFSKKYSPPDPRKVSSPGPRSQQEIKQEFPDTSELADVVLNSGGTTSIISSSKIDDMVSVRSFPTLSVLSGFDHASARESARETRNVTPDRSQTNLQSGTFLQAPPNDGRTASPVPLDGNGSAPSRTLPLSSSVDSCLVLSQTYQVDEFFKTRYTTKAILFTRKLEVPSVWRKVSTATASHCSCAVIKSIDAHLLQRFSIQTIDLPCVLAFDKTGSQALFGGRLSERELVPFLETVSRVKEEVGVDFDVLQI